MASFLGPVRLAALALLLSATAPAEAGAQFRPGRTAWGAPDLQGLWTGASITSLERPPAFTSLVVSDAQARAFEAQHSGSPISGDDPVGAGTSEWWDMGGQLSRVAGQARSSLIVEPADGKLPYTDEGRRLLNAHRAALLVNFDGPEARPSPERCLTAVGGASGAPILNSAYNANLMIVQTPDAVVIVTEMNHDARIVPFGKAPAGVGPSWIGHSVGRFEGATLVVETSGFPPGHGWRMPSSLYMSPEAKVTERFTRTSADEILYVFEVDDPKVFSRRWRAEMPLRPAKGRMFEYACHEGNYSMEGALAGARVQERESLAVAR